MPTSKNDKNPAAEVRKPTQQRSRHKVELMLEAAMRLLDSGGHEALTTNAIAATAGVSIGTLYQFFPNKEAILDALAQREVAGLSERLMATMTNPAMQSPQARIAGLMRAATAGYGQRDRVHRLVMEYSLGRGSRKLAPTIERLIAMMTGDAPDTGGASPRLSRAEAFVITHALVGVVRAMISAQGEDAPPQMEVEQAMARMLSGLAAGHARD